MSMTPEPIIEIDAAKLKSNETIHALFCRLNVTMSDAHPYPSAGTQTCIISLLKRESE